MSCDKKGACGRRIVSVRNTVSREFALCVEGEGQTGASPKPLGRGLGPAYLLSAVSVNKDGKTPAVCCGPGTGRQPGTSATPRECRVLPLVPAEVDVTAHPDNTAGDDFRERLNRTLCGKNKEDIRERLNRTLCGKNKEDSTLFKTNILKNDSMNNGQLFIPNSRDPGNLNKSKR